jgi:RNA polymerase sigma factor (sigma-70 family)
MGRLNNFDADSKRREMPLWSHFNHVKRQKWKRICFAGARMSLPHSGEDEHDSLRDLCVAIAAEFHDPLTKHVRRRCIGTRLESEVEDIVQEAFSRLWQALIAGRRKDLTIHNWKQNANLASIRKQLFGTAKFARWEFYRRQSERETCETPASLLSISDACPVALSEIQAAIQKCTPTQRDTFLLKEEGWTNSEIAAKHGVPVATVRTNYFRARKCLKKILKDYA